MNFRLLLLPLALLLISCSSGKSTGVFSTGRTASTGASTSGSSDPAAGSNGYCMPRKHACEKYEKEKAKKNPQQAKIERYYRECAEYNRSCR